jgi:hypothetical protein
MAHDNNRKDFSSTQLALMFAIGPLFWVVMVVSLGTPIPSGRENNRKTATFLEELCPDRALEPANGYTEPVAALFHLIRTAEPDLARRAINFAAEHEFGHAAPYVIERLESGDAALEATSQGFLRKIAGTDYGPDADGWKAWWRNPPRDLLGFSVGELTFALGFPTSIALCGLALFVTGGRRRHPNVSFVGGFLLVLVWFNLFGLGMTRLMAKQNSCMFGSTRISYFTSHGTVLGLEDARLAGEWMVFILIVAFAVGQFLLAWAIATACASWRKKAESMPGQAARSANSDD